VTDFFFRNSLDATEGILCYAENEREITKTDVTQYNAGN
jgi:hypothetical protein